MQKGQRILFNQEHRNNLYRFFFEKELINRDGEDFYQILLKNYSLEGMHLNAEDANIVMDYTGQTIKGIREVIVEMVRLQEYPTYPTYPSRLSCLYAAKNEEDAWKWKELFDTYNRQVLQMVKLHVNGICFEGDGGLLHKEDGVSFVHKIQQAQNYWSGNTQNVLPELLIEVEIEVVEIVQDFSKKENTKP